MLVLCSHGGIGCEDRAKKIRLQEQDMSQMPQEKTFKKIGQSVEIAFTWLYEGLDLIEQMETAVDEKERERYTALAAMNLHHSWHSMIRLFRRVARDVDEGVPKGTGAPKALIDQMFQRTNDRPNILSIQHLATVQKLSEFHKSFRNSPNVQFSRREIAELMDSLSEEIVPSVLESARVMALSSPASQKMLVHLSPSKASPGTSLYETRKTA